MRVISRERALYYFTNTLQIDYAELLAVKDAGNKPRHVPFQIAIARQPPVGIFISEPKNMLSAQVPNLEINDDILEYLSRNLQNVRFELLPNQYRCFL